MIEQGDSKRSWRNSRIGERNLFPCSAKVLNTIRRGAGHAVVGIRATSCRILPRPSNLGDLAPTAYGYGRPLRCFHADGETALRRTPEMRQVLAAEHLSGHKAHPLFGHDSKSKVKACVFQCVKQCRPLDGWNDRWMEADQLLAIWLRSKEFRVVVCIRIRTPPPPVTASAAHSGSTPEGFRNLGLWLIPALGHKAPAQDGLDKWNNIRPEVLGNSVIQVALRWDHLFCPVTIRTVKRCCYST